MKRITVVLLFMILTCLLCACTVNSDGYTDEELCNAAEVFYYYTHGDRPPHVGFYEENGTVILQLYEDGSGIVTTWDRYYVDRATGIGINEDGDKVDLSSVC